MHANNNEVQLIIKQSDSAEDHQEFCNKAYDPDHAPGIDIRRSVVVGLRILGNEVGHFTSVNVLILSIEDYRYGYYLQDQKHEFGRLQSLCDFSGHPYNL